MQAWGRAALIALTLLVTGEAAAQPGAGSSDSSAISGEGPFLLSAETVSYDTQLEIVTASGNVEISDEERILLADSVSYNIREGTVRASGNISLTEPNGDVIFAEYLELDDSLRTGFIRGIRILMSDNARFAANGGRRFANGDTELAKAVYSPCELCPDDPERAPLWQIKAARVVHDGKEKTVRYRHAVLEFFGVPVAYTPYFEHPDPTVKRKSGFLTPRFGSSSELGLKAEIPYFFNLAPNRDVTLSPLITSKEGVMLQAEYRHRTETGRYRVAGSGTYVDERDDFNRALDNKEFRGHIESDGRFDIDPTWRWGFDVNRTTDDTYLRRYDLSSAHTLTSDLFLEGFRRRNYAHASAFAFQGLRVEDDSGLTPIVAPLLEYEMVTEPSDLGSRYRLGLSAVALQRTDGIDTSRMSARGAWQLPYTSPIGDVYTMTAALTGDLYWIDDVDRGGVPANNADDGFEGRVLPHLAFDWRYPFVRRDNTVRQLIEPIAQVIYTPDDGKSDDIPNEDSISVEFDDTNLFDLNRFPGYDRIETGLRVNYGVKASVYGQSGGYSSLILGQVLRLEDSDEFDTNSGLADSASDLVASLTISPSELFDLTTRFRLDPDNLDRRRNEVYASMGGERLKLIGSYVFLDKDLTANLLEEREELYLWGRARLTPGWSLMAQGRRDLTSDGGTINAGAGLRYEDECLIFEVALERDFTRDRDVEPSTNLNFRVVLKQLN